MKLSIYSIKETFFEGEVEKIVATTLNGEISILEGHIPLISLLKGPHVTTVNSQGKPEQIPLKSGVLEVRPEKEVIILAN